jgi:hypothetical protein
LLSNPAARSRRGFSEIGKQPLFEKSGAKTFMMLGHGLGQRQRPWPSITKFFCFFLFTKRSLSLACLGAVADDLKEPI